MYSKSIQDEEFGIVKLRRLANASSIKISMSQQGNLQATLPKLTPSRYVKKIIDSSRPELRKIIEKSGVRTYGSGMRIGKSHYIIIKPASTLRSIKKSSNIIIYKPKNLEIDSQEVQQEIRKKIISALQSEAKKYLPERLKILAMQNDFNYKRVRFSHAKTRWGSCSSSGTISLNIALMNLPFELIDYVLIHELCHTKEMNHSRHFWKLVSISDPDFMRHRREIKKYSPTI